MNNYITEAEALADIEECRNDGYDYYDFIKDRDKSIKGDMKHYRLNKKKKVGEKIQCAENRCRNMFVKKTYHHVFCCTKHKDKFWNRQRLNDR